MKAVFDIDAGLRQKELGLFATALNNQDFLTKARSVGRLICAVEGKIESINENVWMNGHIVFACYTQKDANALAALLRWRQEQG